MINITSYFKHINAATIYIAPVVCVLILGLVLNLTNPLGAGPGSILLVFVLIYLLFLSTLVAVIRFMAAVWHMVRPKQVISLRRGYYVLSIISLGPVLLVALNTLGQLEILEIILILLLLGLGCFYVLHRSGK